MAWTHANTVLSSMLIWSSTKSSRGFRLDIPRGDELSREVLEIRRDDDLGTDLDGCGEHVAVLGVGELEPFDERLVSGDEAVRDGAIDQLAQAGELLRRDVRAVARQASECLVEDVLGPFCLYQTGPADADQ